MLPPSALRSLAAAAVAVGRRTGGNRFPGLGGRQGAWSPPPPGRSGSTTSGRPWSSSATTPPPPPPPRPPRPPPRGAARSSEQGLYLAALVVGMVGATYGAVPLYR
jgi:hypothetical protein